MKQTAAEYYEEQRKLGNTEDITSNPEPDYHLPFYQAIFRLMEEYVSQSQPQPVSVSEENRNHPHYNLANRFIPVAVYFFKNRVVSLDYVLDGEHYSTDENIASVSERVEFGDTTPHQPTKTDEGELTETLRFAISQLECYHKIANDPGTTDCILKIKAIAKLINGGNE